MNKTPLEPTKKWVKDTVKIHKLITFCKENGIVYQIMEHSVLPITDVMISIPYKEIVITEIPEVKPYE